MSAIRITDPTLKKLVKLLKGIDSHYPDSVTQQMRREYRAAIRPLYGDDYMLEVAHHEVEAAEVALADLEKVGNEAQYNHEVRILRYLYTIHEELDNKWRQMNHMVVGHCGTPCNLGCPECAPGGYDHGGEV